MLKKNISTEKIDQKLNTILVCCRMLYNTTNMFNTNANCDDLSISEHVSHSWSHFNHEHQLKSVLLRKSTHNPI